MAVAVADLDDAGMIAMLRLAHNVRPPRGHRVEHAESPAMNTYMPKALIDFIHMMPPTAITKALIEPTSGQGLSGTRW